MEQKGRQRGGAAEVVFVNGAFLPAHEASISVFDRGFTYGDGLFETMRVYGGRPFALDRHLARLGAGLEALLLPPLGDNANIEETIGELLRLNRLDEGDASIRLTVTRGIDYGGLVPDREPEPSTVIVARSIDTAAIRQWQERGVAAALVKGRPPSLAHVKTLNYLPHLFAKMEAVKRGAAEGLFVENGCVTEGATSNLFAFAGGRLRTPPADGSLLAGVTRGIIRELAAREAVPLDESPLPVEELLKSEEVFISNSLLEIVPLAEIDGTPIGRGSDFPVTGRFQSAYRELTLRERRAENSR